MIAFNSSRVVLMNYNNKLLFLVTTYYILLLNDVFMTSILLICTMHLTHAMNSLHQFIAW
jgi:hypothetical protein